MTEREYNEKAVREMMESIYCYGDFEEACIQCRGEEYARYIHPFVEKLGLGAYKRIAAEMKERLSHAKMWRDNDGFTYCSLELSEQKEETAEEVIYVKKVGDALAYDDRYGTHIVEVSLIGRNYWVVDWYCGCLPNLITRTPRIEEAKQYAESFCTETFGNKTTFKYEQI